MVGLSLVNPKARSNDAPKRPLFLTRFKRIRVQIKFSSTSSVRYMKYGSDISLAYVKSAPSTMSDRFFFRPAPCPPTFALAHSRARSLAVSPAQHSGRKFFERDQKRKLLRRQRKEWKRKEGRGQSRRPLRRREERRRSEAGRKRGWKWNTHHQLENPRAGGRGHLARKLLHRSPHITSEIATVVGDSESRHPDPPSQSAAAARPHLFARSTPCPYASEMDQTWQGLEKQLQVWRCTLMN